MRWAAACAVLAACVPPGPAVPGLPSAGGPAWTELTSAHVILWTDAPVARGRELVREIEERRQLVLGALHAPDGPARIFTVALRDGDELGALVPPAVVAYAWGTPNPVRMPVVVLAAATPIASQHVVAHELTRAILMPLAAHPPRWLAEGLADVFEAARLDGGRAELRAPAVAKRLELVHPMPVAQLVACDAAACETDVFAASAWALAAERLATHPEALLALLQRSAALPAGDALDHELAQWLAHGPGDTATLAIAPSQSPSPSGPATERALGDGDALAARGLLRFMFEHDPARVKPGLDAALAADPTELLARLLVVAITHTTDAAGARATAAAHPQDWRAWWLVGVAVQHGAEAGDARDTLCGLAAKDATMDPPGDLCVPRDRPAAPPPPVKPMAL